MLLGDLNGDHAVTNRDIQGLLNALAASGSVTPIPEPSTFALAALGLLGLVACVRRRVMKNPDTYG